MNSLGKRVCSTSSLVFGLVLLSGCASPPPPPPAAPPPPPVRTCQTMENTDVLGEMRGPDGQVTRVTSTTRCVTQ